MAVVNLNRKRVEAAENEVKPRHIHDGRVPGLILAVNKGQNSWRVKGDLWRNRKKIKTVRHTLGTTAQLDIDEARQQAQEVLRMIRQGVDPNNPEPKSASVAELTVGELWDRYEGWLRKHGRAEKTIEHFRFHLDVYLADWRDRPLVEIKKSICRQRHEELTEKRGPSVGNHAMRSMRAAWNWAIKLDDDGVLPANPVGGVHFNPERRREAVILPEDLSEWWRKVGALPNPLRVAMHRLGLLSGLRPGTLVTLEREWIDLDGQVISIPRMKSGRRFDLPLSAPMLKLVNDAIRVGDALYNEPRWLFPTRTGDGKRLIATQVWREKTIPGETGHILRHTYRTMADQLGIPQSRARALLDHVQPGIEAHYLHSSALRNDLLRDQGRLSQHILEVACAGTLESILRG